LEDIAQKLVSANASAHELAFFLLQRGLVENSGVDAKDNDL